MRLFGNICKVKGVFDDDMLEPQLGQGIDPKADLKAKARQMEADGVPRKEIAAELEVSLPKIRHTSRSRRVLLCCSWASTGEKASEHIVNISQHFAAEIVVILTTAKVSVCFLPSLGRLILNLKNKAA